MSARLNEAKQPPVTEAEVLERLKALVPKLRERTAETERLRSTLLASISHDLRTPLAVMSGASSSLAERGERLSPEERQVVSRRMSKYWEARRASDASLQPEPQSQSKIAAAAGNSLTA